MCGVFSGVGGAELLCLRLMLVGVVIIRVSPHVYIVVVVV